MSSAVKDKARNLVNAVPFYVKGETNTGSLGGLASNPFNQLSPNELENRDAAIRSFKEMQTRFKPSMNDNVGYMFVVVDRDWYWPGQVVEGKIFFETFLPCFQNKLMIKFEGVESFP